MVFYNILRMLVREREYQTSLFAIGHETDHLVQPNSYG